MLYYAMLYYTILCQAKLEADIENEVDVWVGMELIRTGGFLTKFCFGRGEKKKAIV